LILADARFPAGGHAHSGGVEAAVAAGRVRDVPTLRAFLVGRLHTVLTVDAALAAATVHGARELSASALSDRLTCLDREAAARLAAPALRRTSRQLGRQLLRAAAATWPSPVLTTAQRVQPEGLHLAVASGAVGAAAGLDTRSTALAVAYGGLAASAMAAVRLLGIDPFAVSHLLASLGPELEALADAACEEANAPLCQLPAASAPWCELAAEEHARWEVRLFAS
jgi:urease accessory protein